MERGLNRSFMAALLSSVLFFIVFIGTGCGEKVGDEPTKYQSQAGLEKLTMQAQTTQNNPGFSLARNILPQTLPQKISTR